MKRFVSRRKFIKNSFKIASFIFTSCFIFSNKIFCTKNYSISELKEASFYIKLSNQEVQCQLCFRNCLIKNGNRGFCSTRENQNGILYALTYNSPAAIHIDPVEKIPFMHFLPGTDALCIGTAGCNLKCLNCINWHFALKKPDEVDSLSYSSIEIVKMAKDNDLKTICFTYNEPTICYEFMLDVFKLAKKEGLNTAFHTNASMNVEPLKELLKYTDAIVADLKSFDEGFYNEICSSSLKPVLEFLKTVYNNNTWFEIVNLIIPGKNDNNDLIKKMCLWIKDNIGLDTPIQFSRFFPTHKLTKLPPTPISVLENTCEIASIYNIHYIYIGNVAGINQINTYCPYCKKMIIERRGLQIINFLIVKNRCKFCKKEIKGKWL